MTDFDDGCTSGSTDDADSDLETRIADALGAAVAAIDPLDGGEVGSVYRVALADGRTVAAKTGDTPLDVEADMLDFLGDRGLPVPELHHRSADLLVMAYVEGDADFSPAVARDVARHLAALHEETSRETDATPEADETDRVFGFPDDTLDGPYRQPNPWTDSWVEFYRDHRLRYAAENARSAGLLSTDLAERIERLAGDLVSWLPDDPEPSLLHGDAWTNNVIVANGAVRAFLDPACYFGHSEVELAYADFTGSFGEPFFETYREERGIDVGFFEGRREIYQLSPLLVHLLYFGDERYAVGLREKLRALDY